MPAPSASAPGDTMPRSPSVPATTTGHDRPTQPRHWPGWAWLVVLAAVVAAAWMLVDAILVDRRPIVVGILHSQTGPMAAGERAMIDAEVLALEEINRAGGLLGRQVRWVIADGASDLQTYKRQAEALIR